MEQLLYTVPAALEDEIGCDTAELLDEVTEDLDEEIEEALSIINGFTIGGFQW